MANGDKGTQLAKAIVQEGLKRGLIFRAAKNGREIANYVDPLPKNRKRYNEACVGFCFGDEAPEPCKKCANGDGKFPYCIVVTTNGEPCWGGACVCCRAQDHPDKCSLYEEEDQVGNGDAAVPAVAANGGVGGEIVGVDGGDDIEMGSMGGNEGLCVSVNRPYTLPGHPDPRWNPLVQSSRGNRQIFEGNGNQNDEAQLREGISQRI